MKYVKDTRDIINLGGLVIEYTGPKDLGRVGTTPKIDVRDKRKVFHFLERQVNPETKNGYIRERME